MVSHLFFYQLTLITLVWLCVMLHWAWPSDSAAACSTTLAPHPHGQSATVRLNPLKASSTSRPATPVSTPLPPPASPLSSAPAHRAHAGAPPPRRHLDALLPEPRLCLSGLGWLGQSPGQ